MLTVLLSKAPPNLHDLHFYWKAWCYVKPFDLTNSNKLMEIYYVFEDYK